MAAVDWIQRPAQNSINFSDWQAEMAIINDNNYLFQYFLHTSWGPEYVKIFTISVNVWLVLHVKNMKLELDFKWLKYAIFRVHSKKVFHFKTELIIPSSKFEKWKKKCDFSFPWPVDTHCNVGIFLGIFYFIW